MRNIYTLEAETKKIIEGRIWRLESYFYMYQAQEKILTNEYQLFKDEKTRYSKINNKIINSIVNLLIDENPFLMMRDEEFGYTRDISELIPYLEYRDVLQRARKIVLAKMENISREILSDKKLIGDISIAMGPQYRIICREFIKLLKENNLYLEKSDKQIYEIIADKYYTEWTTVKVQIDKHKNEIPGLIEIFEKRRKARAEKRANRKTYNTLKRKQKRK